MFEGVYISTSFYFSQEVNVFHIFGPRQEMVFWPRQLCRKGWVQFKRGHTCIVSGVRWVNNFRNVLRRQFLKNLKMFTHIPCETLSSAGSQFILIN